MLAKIDNKDRFSEHNAVRLTACYIVKGFFEHVGFDMNNMPEGEGEIELVDRLGDLAHLVEHEYCNLNEISDDGCAGVWEYEVSETLGRWLATHVSDNGDFPSIEEIKKKIHLLGLDAFDMKATAPIIPRLLDLTAIARELNIEVTLKMSKEQADLIESEIGVRFSQTPDKGCWFDGMKIKVK